jgi:hypothetical protein
LSKIHYQWGKQIKDAYEDERFFSLLPLKLIFALPFSLHSISLGCLYLISSSYILRLDYSDTKSLNLVGLILKLDHERNIELESSWFDFEIGS